LPSILLEQTPQKRTAFLCAAADDQAALNGIIPDALIDARAIPQPKDFHFTKIHGKVSLVEVKETSSQKQTVEERANLIESDIEKAAASLDAKYAGSTVLAEKRKHGKDGKYLAFVTGSLCNFSAGVYTFTEFISGAQTTRALQWRNTSREQLLSMYHHYLISSFGLFAARLWARHGRFRDAVAVTAPCHAPLLNSDPGREAVRDFNLGRSRARGVQHRCACFA
jgi:hypothetical protein